MKKILLALFVGILVLHAGRGRAADITVSEATAECLECHAVIHPGIVKDWQDSRHAKITPKQAMAVDGLALKVSSKTVPDNLQNNTVGCAECHTLRPKAHADTFEHNGYDVHVVVSPNDCATCHSSEAEQYTKNLMSHAYDNLDANQLYQKLQLSIIGRKKFKDGKITLEPANAATKAETCYYCHGTKLKVTGTETRDTELAGELEFPIINGWPNQGVGRVNLDGSRGSCAACHTRHAFSIEMARKPYTCKECHVGPDVPAFKVYAASKHGNIFSAMNQSWDFNAVPWTIGQDFTAPTCGACHVSLLVNTEEEVVSERTHQMNNRLPWRIFGLVYAHPHPQSPDTTVIRNKDGQPLPTSLDGEFAADYLIDETEMTVRRKTMQAACLNCHGASWVNGQWKRFENTIRQTNAELLTATGIMREIWQKNLADFGANPFDEAIEKKWTDAWQFYANTIRFASAMGCGGDYGVYADGRYHLTQALFELNDWRVLQEKVAAQSK
ncbi:MAG: hydroxylamine oxidase [Deltaproteobacteria bacterium]|jgi:cytochrome c553|nr:hydroxylamine oxidase [Deltaproteobacteria bacterium]